MPKSRICSVNDCGKRHLAAGLCSAHYQRIKRTGRLAKVKQQCSSKGCEKFAVKRGCCEFHYRQLMKIVELVRCSVPECELAHVSKGYCSHHYYMATHRGDATGPRKQAQPGTLLRFVYEVALKHDSDDCLFWPYALKPNGYGTIGVDSVTYGAHRFVCILAHGTCPPDKPVVAHRCGKRSCVNPKHLRWANNSENQLDRAKHGTDVRGTRNMHNKLSEDDVREIRSLRPHMTLKDLGGMFGVSLSLIGRICTGRCWKWLA